MNVKELLQKKEVRVALVVVAVALGLWWLGVLGNCNAVQDITGIGESTSENVSSTVTGTQAPGTTANTPTTTTPATGITTTTDEPTATTTPTPTTSGTSTTAIGGTNTATTDSQKGGTATQ